MRKVKIVLRTASKGAKKLVREGPKAQYRGVPVYKLPILVTKKVKQLGFKPTLVLIKKGILSIDQRHGPNLTFPNGLITGVDQDTINSWFKARGRSASIIIPSYNDYELLKPNVEKLLETVPRGKMELIIVDDYCQPESREYLKEFEKLGAKVIYREKNGGYAQAVTTGFEAANPKNDVILLNSDIIAHNGWFEALQYGAYVFGVDTGIVGPKLLYPDGRIQSAGSYRNTEVPEFFDHYYRFQDANYGPANIPQYCLAVTGACQYIKREFLNNVGSIDPGFAFAFEDVDICLRGWQQGYRTLYFPAAVLTHVESASRPKHKTLSEKEQASVKYFWDKWGDWFDKRNVRDETGRIRIIYVLQTLGYSGGIKIVFEHANRLIKKGYAVEIWGLDAHDCPWELEEGVKMRTFKNYERMTTALTNQEAIKVATWWETSYPVWLASVTKGIAVNFIQEIESWFYPNDVVAQSTVISCYRKEFKNMTTSQYNLGEIKQLGLRAVAVPCGYDDKTYYLRDDIKRSDSTLLAVGRSFFQKNLKMTLRAWQSLGEDRPVLRLFGSEPELARKDSKIEYLKSPSNEDVNRLYNEATMFIQTSRHEGFCLPLLEAMAAGCPVICTDAHGNRDFCFKDKNCLMVEQDDAEGLAKAMKKLLSSPKLQKELSRAGLKTARDYRWDVVIDRVDAFYQEVAKR